MARLETISDDLRRDILTGEFPPGERLLEVNLTARYGCGRAAVRGALVELAAEGLVEREANRGAKVRRISVEEAIQITEARAALEGLIASRAARNATDDDRVELRRVIADMRGTVDEGRGADYSALNALLHRRIREISQHSVAAGMVSNLRDRAAHHQYRLALMPGRPEESVEQHAAIVDAIVAGDQLGAAEAMSAHLESVIATLTRWGDAGGVNS